MTVYDNVKRIADDKGLSIRQIEKQAGLGNGTIAGWKNYDPKMVNIKAVADVLKVKVVVLMKGVL